MDGKNICINKLK